MSYIRKMIERDKAMRITVGCRCALKPESSWAKGMFHFEPGRHVILDERSDRDFSAIVLPKGFTGQLTKDVSLYDNHVAWIDEDDLELIDRDFATNIDFIDWFQEVKEDICGDCGKALYDEEGICPNPKCPGNDMELLKELSEEE